MVIIGDHFYKEVSMEREAYIKTFFTHDSPLTEKLELEAEARDDIQPFVERESARLISLLIRSGRPKKVLELGTGIGYSTIWLGEAVKAVGSQLFSVDNHERTGVEAAANIIAAGLEDSVTLLTGDAEVLVPKLVREEPESFGLIFQDCGKHLYPLLYEDVYQLLEPNGILVTDDTLFRVSNGVRKGLGDHVDRYNNMLYEDSRFYSTMLPVGHGISVSLKIG